MDIHRSYFYYTEKKDDSEVEAAIREAAEFGDGFWKIADYRRSGIYKVLLTPGIGPLWLYTSSRERAPTDGLYGAIGPNYRWTVNPVTHETTYAGRHGGE